MIRVSRLFTGSFLAVAMLMPLDAQEVETENVSAIAEIDEQEMVDGKVSAVTLYRQQALVTRNIPVNGKVGSRELVVTNLPAQLMEGSVFAEGAEGIEIRAVRLRTRAVGEEPREEVRELDNQLQELNDKLEANKKANEVLAKRSAYLDKMETFSASTSSNDLSKGNLDAEALQKLTMFLFEQRSSISDEQLKLSKDAREIQKQVQLLTRKRGELTSNATKNVREAVLFVEKTQDGNAAIRLNYIVSNCGWSPSYTFRADTDRTSVRAEYNAMIYQMTGENWDDVQLTLSTASPALACSGPGLAPFHISLNAASQQQMGQTIVGNPSAGAKIQLAEQFKSLQKQQMQYQDANVNAINIRGNIESSWGMNSAACDINLLELTVGKDILGGELGNLGVGDEPSMSYELASAVSLASRSDQQLVRILQTSFESDFYYVATPVLTSYVYREAELVNNSDQDLLAGPITVYLDGRFVGRGEIPSVTRSQSFVVGFGADSQLRIRRELASRDESVQGGNREIDINYRLVVDNYKPEAVALRIYERLPYNNSSNDVRVTLNDADTKLSQDKLYLRRERPKGILRYDIEVAASTNGENAQLLEYGYKIEHDRNYQLAVMANQSDQLQQEFESLQRSRLKN